MAAFRPELKFVAFDKPGRGTKPGGAYALRSHVRRMIALDKASRPQRPALKFVTVHPVCRGRSAGRMQKKSRPGKGTRDPRSGCHKTADLELPGAATQQGTIHERGCSVVAFSASKPSARANGQPKVTTLPLHYHPFTSIAAEHVDLPVHRLDQLFKSEAFRHAAEPLFDTSHVDSSMNISSVFPTCFQSRAFFNALVYSVIQAFNCGKTTLEQLKQRSSTIAALQDAFLSTKSTLTTASTVGAIMILRGTAYKWEDAQTHALHARGLATVLQTTEPHLTAHARRALFWQDLFASILISTPRHLSHASLPEHNNTTHHSRAPTTYINTFPRGFLRHRAILPDTLLACIHELTELQSAARTCTATGPAKHAVLEPLQARIESRLAFQATSCAHYGLVASATRLAVFIVTYTSYMTTWDFSLIPGRLAEQLVGLLEPSLVLVDVDADVDGRHDRVWRERWDVLLWLLLVGASAAYSDGGVIEDLRGRYARALGAYGELVVMGDGTDAGQEEEAGQTTVALSGLLRSALGEFALAAGWKERRFSLYGWAELEGRLQAASAGRTT